MNKKQKKQLDVARKKLNELQTVLANERKQPDEPGEVERLEAEIKKVEAQIESIKAGG